MQYSGLHAFTPAPVVVALHVHADGAVWVQWLFASPCNALHHARTNLKFRRELYFAGVPHWQQKRTLTQSAAERISRVECASRLEFSIRALALQPQHPRHAGHAAIRCANDQLRCAITFSLPDPCWPQP